MPFSNDPTIGPQQRDPDLSPLTVIKYGGNALTNSGIRATVRKRKLSERPEDDPGQIGDKIDPSLIHLLVKKGYIPVVAPIGPGTDGRLPDALVRNKPTGTTISQ